jgi:hypothetical protein
MERPSLCCHVSLKGKQSTSIFETKLAVTQCQPAAGSIQIVQMTDNQGVRWSTKAFHRAAVETHFGKPRFR